jgi:hypothetical protein
MLSALDLSRIQLAQLLGYTSRTVRRWVSGTRAVPRETIILLRLVLAGKIAIADIAAAAAARPRRDIEPDAVPTADQEPAAERGVGIGQLNSRVCRWPLWGNETPAADRMRFCGEAAIIGSPYCSAHAATAAPPPRNYEAPAGRGQFGCKPNLPAASTFPSRSSRVEGKSGRSAR